MRSALVPETASGWVIAKDDEPYKVRPIENWPKGQWGTAGYSRAKNFVPSNNFMHQAELKICV